MKVTEFAKKITAREGGKVEVNIAQVMDVLKAANEITKGLLYAIIKWL